VIDYDSFKDERLIAKGLAMTIIVRLWVVIEVLKGFSVAKNSRQQNQETSKINLRSGKIQQSLSKEQVRSAE